MSRRRTPPGGGGLTIQDCRVLAEFRHLLRQFFVFSEDAARRAGITAQQHRALLSIKAFDGTPTVGDLASDLVIKHHSAVGLVDRLVEAGLVNRHQDDADRRRVALQLTGRGEKMLLTISGVNRQELRRLTPLLRTLLSQLER